MSGLRARVRAELLAEIKRLARDQMREHGPASLSLRAIARDLGMASSAIYRYFASRDDLLTALIIDAYDDLGERAEAADAPFARTDVDGRFRAVTHAAYEWARAETAQYGLIFGTPVPGYAAPEDTIGPATRYSQVLVGILADGLAVGRRPTRIPHISPSVGTDLTALELRTGIQLDPAVMLLGIHVWTSLFGTITFLLYGHLHNVVVDDDAFFADIVDHLAAEILAEPTST